jgi:phage terminase large subunit-like protein
MSSLKRSLGSLKPTEREELENLIEEVGYRWSLQARDKQKLPPGDWITWLLLAGRGFGKTRTGAETVRIWSDQVPKIHLIARTATDVRDTMVEGEAGILEVHPDRNRPKYEPSKKRLTWPNGCRAQLFSADEPDLLRGPQCYKLWADEVASWQYAQETWDMALMGLRLGKSPQAVVTTTPRPIPTIKELVEDLDNIITTGSTYENEDNLSEVFIKKVIKKYEGTRLGRQELYAELLEDIDGALWTQRMIEQAHVKEAPALVRIVVAIDPAVTSDPDSDETGIVVAGIGFDGHAYILDDLTGNYTPTQWARRAIGAYTTRKADRVIGEANNGGDLIEEVIRTIDKQVSYSKVWASRGKVTRAEPVQALYEQRRVKHVGSLPELETEMTTWAAKEGEKSPNRVDALVWAVSELMLNDDTFFVV